MYYQLSAYDIRSLIKHLNKGNLSISHCCNTFQTSPGIIYEMAKINHNLVSSKIGLAVTGNTDNLTTKRKWVRWLLA